jgi:hypothetical protein
MDYLPSAPVSRLRAVKNLATLTVWRQYLLDRNDRQVQVSVSSELRMTTWINSLLRLRTSQELLTNPWMSSLSERDADGMRPARFITEFAGSAGSSDAAGVLLSW